MNDNIITWNVTNWVTIFLMAVGGFFLLGVATKGAKGAKKVIAARSGNTSVAA